MRLKPLAFIASSSALSFMGCGQDSETSMLDAADRVAASCGITPACDAAPRAVGPKKGFFTAKPIGKPYHYGRDFYYNETEDQWIIAKFQYGNYLLRAPLKHEEVEVQLLRDCGSTWEGLGKTYTTGAGDHMVVNHVVDDGGMVYFKIPDANKLGLGRHRIRLVVSGDQTATELYLEILSQGTTLFVSDVDGTLTKGELSEGLATLFGTLPPPHPGAAELFTGLVKKGYRPLYLTARSTNLVQRTRDFISTKNFPAGVVQTSSAKTFGISGDKAVAYKSEVLQGLESRGFRIAYGFGNTEVDAEAFARALIPDNNKYFFDYEDYTDFGGGYSHKNYASLQTVKEADDLCL